MLDGLAQYNTKKRGLSPVFAKRIEKMGPKEKRQIIQLLDTFIEREELKQQASA